MVKIPKKTNLCRIINYVEPWNRLALFVRHDTEYKKSKKKVNNSRQAKNSMV